MDIRIEGLTLRYGEAVAVRNLDLTVGDGESLVLLGESGCGKTSTMRCIAGLEHPSAGRIAIGGDVLFDGERNIDRPPHKRNIGMVFQSYAIWPHMTVFENVAFPLSMQRVCKADIARRVRETLELVGLAEFADRGASMLSGGQMQRVALARSVVMEPSVMLLDEPLSNLDARLRHRLRGDLRELQTRLGLTSVYVTHDQEEALALADRIAMMQHGRIVQIGRPNEIYAKPLSASIADFLGVGNILPVQALDSTGVRIADSAVTLSVAPYDGAGELKACIRGEDIAVGDDVEPGMNVLEGKLLTKEFLGASATYRVAIADTAELEIIGGKHRQLTAAPGDTVRIGIPADAVQVLPHEVGQSTGQPQAATPVQAAS
ncbi:ABC transporter ATP-binding protein [Mycolicibacterium goodii]|uniref:ABC transporter ATP-binding protein n=1 Tax=Mycolicibacterium goodii TaxID=134601 RepID=UPI000C2661F3|nr:ABC transporter ATP-binding protein [Mycolicibacterium goodii]PJK23995.1 ABC transporter ATP-binding protein [Mycolicibacterium goodii]